MKQNDDFILNGYYDIIIIIIFLIFFIFYDTLLNIDTGYDIYKDTLNKNEITIGEKLSKNIFIYWEQGWDNAPKICKECLKSWKYYNSNWNIIILDKYNIYEYLDKNLLKKVFEITKHCHQADVIRLHLLEKYGGVWVDATSFCTQPLDNWLHKYMNTGFFVFNYNKSNTRLTDKILRSLIGNTPNWFIASYKNNYIVKVLKNTYTKYWKNKNSSINYHNFYRVFENLKKFNRNFKNIFDNIPKYDCHELEFDLIIELTKLDSLEYTTPKIKNLINNRLNPLHKFTYKIPKFNKIIENDSIFDYIINLQKK